MTRIVSFTALGRSYKSDKRGYVDYRQRRPKPPPSIFPAQTLRLACLDTSTMQDPFLDLSTELRIEILKALNLPSVYAAIRAFLSLAQTFYTYPNDIIQSSIQQYPRSIQRCIRTGITLSRLPTQGISYGLFVKFHIYGHASDVPNAPLSLVPAHRLLFKAWKLHWAAQSCLKDLTTRIDKACRSWTKKNPDEPPAPFSWVEEHRVLRAYWRAQLSLDFCDAADMFPRFARLNTANLPLQVWTKLASFERKELGIIMQYETHKKCLRENYSLPPELLELVLENCAPRHDCFYTKLPSDHVQHWQTTPIPPCEIEFSEILFSEDMVQSTWPTPDPGGDPLSFFAGQDENHLNFPASFGTRIYHTMGLGFRGDTRSSGLDIQHTEWDPLKQLGASLWDKRRMYMLGISNFKWDNCLKYQLPSVDVDPSGLPVECDSLTMCTRWQKLFRIGGQMMLGEAD